MKQTDGNAIFACENDNLISDTFVVALYAIFYGDRLINSFIDSLFGSILTWKRKFDLFQIFSHQSIYPV